MSTIDITKTYTTRKGLRVHLYERRNDYFYGRYCESLLGEVLDNWTPVSWNAYGICCQNIGTDFDLVPAKTWRAWKDGEGPKRLMIRAKNSPNGSCEVLVREGFSYSSERLFADFMWLHEDATETPCGVLDG